MREHTSGVRSCPSPSSVFLPDDANWTIGSLSSPRRTTPIEMPGMEPFRLTSSIYERSCGESRLSVWRNVGTEAGEENGACSPAHALHVSPATKREHKKRSETMAVVADRKAEGDYALQEKVSKGAALRTELSRMTVQ